MLDTNNVNIELSGANNYVKSQINFCVKTPRWASLQSNTFAVIHNRNLK